MSGTCLSCTHQPFGLGSVWQSWLSCAPKSMTYSAPRKRYRRTFTPRWLAGSCEGIAAPVPGASAQLVTHLSEHSGARTAGQHQRQRERGDDHNERNRGREAGPASHRGFHPMRCGPDPNTRSAGALAAQGSNPGQPRDDHAALATGHPSAGNADSATSSPSTVSPHPWRSRALGANASPIPGVGNHRRGAESTSWR